MFKRSTLQKNGSFALTKHGKHGMINRICPLALAWLQVKSFPFTFAVLILTVAQRYDGEFMTLHVKQCHYKIHTPVKGLRVVDNADSGSIILWQMSQIDQPC